MIIHFSVALKFISATASSRYFYFMMHLHQLESQKGRYIHHYLQKQLFCFVTHWFHLMKLSNNVHWCKNNFRIIKKRAPLNKSCHYENCYSLSKQHTVYVIVYRFTILEFLANAMKRYVRNISIFLYEEMTGYDSKYCVCVRRKSHRDHW